MGITFQTDSNILEASSDISGTVLWGSSPMEKGAVALLAS